jgi:hypothetical protein
MHVVLFQHVYLAFESPRVRVDFVYLSDSEMGRCILPRIIAKFSVLHFQMLTEIVIKFTSIHINNKK